MPELKRNFIKGRMNKDLDERLVPNGEYRDALNVEVSTSEEDDVGALQTTMGNIKAPNVCNLSSGKSHTLKKYAQTICDIVGYDYNLIKWDTNAFVGSKNKKLVNTQLKGFKFTSLKKGLKKTIQYYEDSINSSK